VKSEIFHVPCVNEYFPNQIEFQSAVLEAQFIQMFADIFDDWQVKRHFHELDPQFLIPPNTQRILFAAIEFPERHLNFPRQIEVRVDRLVEVSANR
jgi:hypothetical protein